MTRSAALIAPIASAIDVAVARSRRRRASPSRGGPPPAPAEGHAATGRVGVLAQEDRVLRVAAGRDEGGHAVAVRAHGVEDVARAEGERLDGREVEERERVAPFAQLEARDHAAQRRVGARRAVAVVIGQHVEVAREGGGEGDSRFGRERVEALR